MEPGRHQLNADSFHPWFAQLGELYRTAYILFIDRESRSLQGTLSPSERSRLELQRDMAFDDLVEALVRDEALLRALEQVLDDANAVEWQNIRAAFNGRRTPALPDDQQRFFAEEHVAREVAVAAVRRNAARLESGDRRVGVTSLLVHNIPRSLTQEDVVTKMLVEGSCNFLHFPRHMESALHTRTAVINFVSQAAADAFLELWDGRRLEPLSEPLVVAPAPIHGRDAHLRQIDENAEVLPVVWIGRKRFERAGVMQLIRLAKEEVIFQ